jgi:hypothetical protein
VTAHGSLVVGGCVIPVAGNVARMSSGDRGVAFWREPGKPGEVFLIVDGGRVVACTKHAESWALNRTAAQLLERGQRVGAEVEWIALKSVPTLVLLHRTPHTRLRRWKTEGYAGVTRTLTFATTADGYLLDDDAEKIAWVFGDRDDCVTVLRRRLRGGEWVRIYASAGGDDPELPAEWNVPD